MQNKTGYPHLLQGTDFLYVLVMNDWRALEGLYEHFQVSLQEISHGLHALRELELGFIFRNDCANKKVRQLFIVRYVTRGNFLVT